MKRMESGSLLAIWAMCFRMSFLVMIPSSLLQGQRRDASDWLTSGDAFRHLRKERRRQLSGSALRVSRRRSLIPANGAEDPVR